MSGHSKWANIKHKKEKTDAQKGNLFSKIGKELAIAVKHGGPDPVANSRLRDVIAKARAANMPNDNIMRSIKKASGEEGGANIEEVAYEGYGPGGVAMIIETLTENKNRTGSDVRHYLDKYGGNLGAVGCVSWMFSQKGVIVIEKSAKIDEDTLMMEALEAGAEDFTAGDEYFEILTAPTDFSKVREALEGKYSFASAEIEMVPSTMTKIEDEKDREKMEKLLELLEEHDDVQNVWHNWDQ